MSTLSYDEMTEKMTGKRGKLSRNNKILLRAMKKGKTKERLTKEFMRNKAKKANRKAEKCNTVYQRTDISDVLPATAKLYEEEAIKKAMDYYMKLIDEQYDQMIRNQALMDEHYYALMDEEYDRMILDYWRDEENYKDICSTCVV